MSGPKPNPANAFIQLHVQAGRLYRASTTDQQRNVVLNLIAGLSKVAPLWDVAPSSPAPKATRKEEKGVIRVTLTPTQVGYRDYQLNYDCPFPDGSTEAEQWLEGWNQAQAKFTMPETNSTE